MTKLSHAVDDRLEANGFVMGGLPPRIRYCSVCEKRLVPLKQWFKALQLNVPQACFCRGCAVKQLE